MNEHERELEALQKDNQGFIGSNAWLSELRELEKIILENFATRSKIQTKKSRKKKQ